VVEELIWHLMWFLVRSLFVWFVGRRWLMQWLESVPTQSRQNSVDSVTVSDTLPTLSVASLKTLHRFVIVTSVLIPSCISQWLFKRASAFALLCVFIIYICYVFCFVSPVNIHAFCLLYAICKSHCNNLQIFSWRPFRNVHRYVMEQWQYVYLLHCTI